MWWNSTELGISDYVSEGTIWEEARGYVKCLLERARGKAVSTIYLCLADEIMYHVINVKSPSEVWLNWRVVICRSFSQISCIWSSSSIGLRCWRVQIQHANVFNQIINDSLRLDIEFDDKGNVMVLICSIPPLYDHLSTTLTWGKETLKLEEVTSALLTYYLR